ncbi:MAG: hypothetical protein DSY33_02075 [Archaeoglobus sp.]|jgi:deoxyribonuclease-4|nr:MAG: hypothetical protein DSY33_02075 [Archaeoglobus sp.]
MLFGVAGVPHSSRSRSTLDGVKAIKKLGLDAMEVQFVRGVRMKEEKAKEVGMLAKSLNVTLTVHAPYYINLNSDDKFEASVRRLYDSARIGSFFDSKGVVFHPGYYLKSSKQKAYERVKAGIERTLDMLEKDGIDAKLRPETTGKPTQFGELDELLNLSAEFVEIGYDVKPCIDFAHIHARYRRYNSYDEFCEIFEKVEVKLGRRALRSVHIHLSGIEYGMRGEREHLNLEESDMNWRELLMAIKDVKVDGILICESPNLEVDAVMLKNAFMELKF